MDSIAMTDIIIFAILIAIFWNALGIKRNQQAMSQTLQAISNRLSKIEEPVKHSYETELNTIRAINEMCNALNQSFSTTGVFMNHTSYTLKNITVCMIPFINDVKERALKNEEYEKAQECVNIINNLKEIIKPTSNN